MTVILLRHGRSSANTAATLAGRTPGVGLDETGRAQAQRAARRLGGLPIVAIISSPQQRCIETVGPLAEAHDMQPHTDESLAEVDYGEWTGRALSELVAEPLWRVIQQQPSAATFPGGECLAAVQARSVGAIRSHDARLRAEHGENALWVACTHGDVIKSILADALGMHLDGFQRIATVPGAISVIRYTEARPIVQHLNDTGSALDGLARNHRDAREGRPECADDDGPSPDGAAASPFTAGVPGGEI
ncbi:histidine phosphatase family protein [Tomitella fengzijianii]|uniref:MSMEG_4193 family putative phosphomutase n=1 Tax=Tomitella fengzijianii TaxID=2597660 RepID=A0A516X2U7_9ACTN|nr:histidine phosphatase family protein [Tomitella fengzijianii]QDQ97394.1 MSMEG_4193 family putative phosphomutase [Tomitella fengzijianii]